MNLTKEEILLLYKCLNRDTESNLSNLTAFELQNRMNLIARLHNLKKGLNHSQTARIDNYVSKQH